MCWRDDQAASWRSPPQGVLIEGPAWIASLRVNVERSSPSIKTGHGSTPNRKIRILGIGSPSGDDQAGWLVAQALENRLPPDVVIQQLDRPGSALIPLLENADSVILIDAMQGGGRAGAIRHFINDEWKNYGQGLSSHGLGVFDALMLARELDCLPESLDLYGIEIGSALPGDSPSAAVMSAAEELADTIANIWRHAPN